MLNSSRKAKGKRLEDYVVLTLKEFDDYVYRRADSGSGYRNKEDVTTKLPFHIECKNQEVLSINKWWDQTCIGCPKSKYPVLIYKKNYQKDPMVYMKLSDVISFISDGPIDNWEVFITLTYSQFLIILRKKYGKANNSGYRP